MIDFFELHNDFYTTIKSDKRRERYIRSIKQNCEIMAAVYTTEMKSEDAIKAIEGCYKFVEKNNDKLSESYQKRLHLAVEDLGFITKTSLERVINCAPSYCTLTWNYQNLLAGGAVEGGDLTLFGQSVVKKLEEAHIFVDTAHLCERSFMGVSNITTRPILCSHTAVRTLVNNPRNLKDYQIRMIVESGGLMGIALVSDFLSGEKKSRVSDVARHIDYVVSRYGDDNIALGTDFYGTKHTPVGIKNYNNLGLIIERLKFLGYSDETIEKIFYKNAKNFFKGM